MPSDLIHIPIQVLQEEIASTILSIISVEVGGEQQKLSARNLSKERNVPLIQPG
jgi:hypothetical protein